MDNQSSIPSQLNCLVQPMAVREWVRSSLFNRHHLKPRSRGGTILDSNLLRMEAERHKAWHFLFANLTLNEIINVLKCLLKLQLENNFSNELAVLNKFHLNFKASVKSRNRKNQRVEYVILLLDTEHYKAWYFLFGRFTLNEVIEVLERIRDAKKRQSEQVL